MFDKYEPEKLDQSTQKLHELFEQLGTEQEFLKNIVEQGIHTQNTALIDTALESYKKQEKIFEEISICSKETSKQIKLARKDMEKNIKILKILEELP